VFVERVGAAMPVDEERTLAAAGSR
jgi:hypothetical protein